MQTHIVCTAVGLVLGLGLAALLGTNAQGTTAIIVFFVIVSNAIGAIVARGKRSSGDS